ncbi:GNAT family N-acetyltransferase [Lacticaseibacillus absianus]|uniref:GNAT family N-acetyltransferase n=1 Tax=Lacticaseibacillus absianus TaxID=2729623 RepID=UPI0015C885AF|nr:GNAT family N-acetyltransferase [Lacticaseibacillus absianus]
MTVTLKPVSSMQDRKLVLDLYQGAADYFALTGQGYPSRATVEEDRTARPAQLPANAKHYGVLMTGATAVGVLDYVVGYPTVDSLYIGLLLLPVTQRRRGLGTQVVAQLHAEHPECRRFRVAVADANEGGMQFWLAQGFRFVRAGQASLGTGHTLAVTLLDRQW